MAQTLQTMIVINAKAGSGFSAVGATLTELGSMVNGVSQELINFGKESVDVYRNYELSMKDAEVALSTTYGRGTQQLSAVMNQLDESATEWAATTIFHTNDVGNAIAEMAHAGWDLDQIMAGMPSAMRLAQAGSLDLSEAVDYIVKSTNAAGISFEDVGTFIDHWAFAANSSATNIDELGAAMLRMGGTMKFAENTDELFTMLAVLADTGYVGESAGTLLRNSMIRLVAPTKNAREAMGQLGATSDEVAELLNDTELAAANARLAAQGFSLYDEDGNMKSMLDTYRDLYVALGEVNGGFENIEKNADVEAILGAIFPQRSITGALALLEAASNGYGGLYEALQGGDAEGYGRFAADTMMDSLNGKIETFESKVERLKQLVGEELADQLKPVLETAGEFVDKLAGIDEGPFGAIVTGLEILAGAGPALLLAGTALRFIGAAMNPINAIGLGAIGFLAVVSGLERMAEIDFENQFGDLSLNMNDVSSCLGELASSFEQANSQVTAYSEAVDAAVESYKTASSTFKTNLLTDMLTGATLGDTEIDQLKSLGEQMITSVKDGVENNYASVMQSITDTFGDEGADSPVLAEMMQVLEDGFAKDIGRAEELSKQLRDAMTSAFKDGHLTGDEVANIQSIMDEQNELLARQQDIENYAARQSILRKGQTLGLEGVQEAVGLARTQMEAEREQLLTQQDRDYATLAAAYDYAIENGTTFGGEEATEESKAAALKALKESQADAITRLTAGENAFILETMQEAISSSELGDTWSAFEQLGASISAAGGRVTPGAAEEFNNAVGADFARVSGYLDTLIENLGGVDAIGRYAREAESNGDAQMAGLYRTVMGAYQAISTGGGTVTAGATGTADYGDISQYSQLSSMLAEVGTTIEGMINTMNSRGIANGFVETPEEASYYQLEPSDFDVLRGAADKAGYDTLEAWVNAVSAMGPIPVPIEPQIEASEVASMLSEGDVEAVQVDADTTEVHAKIKAEEAEPLMMAVSGTTDELHAQIWDENGQNLLEYVNGDDTALANAINRHKGEVVTVVLQTVGGIGVTAAGFALGGRATTASIFGEAGPEWAIPEEHSERTASLLDAARAASGFSWAELIARNGGLNANAENVPATIIYSPTIHAADATGVEQALMRDKERLNRWYEDKVMRDKVEVYA